jgi:hypothetical protein
MAKGQRPADAPSTNQRFPIGIEGTGVDISTVFVEAARKRADELGVTSQVDLIVEDAAKFQAEPDSYDVVSCIGANWIGGGTRGTLELIKGKGQKPGPDSLILMGEIFWRAAVEIGAAGGCPMSIAQPCASCYNGANIRSPAIFTGCACANATPDHQTPCPPCPARSFDWAY